MIKQKKFCKIEGCNLPSRSKGYCNKHYQKISQRASDTRRETKNIERSHIGEDRNKNKWMLDLEGCQVGLPKQKYKIWVY